MNARVALIGMLFAVGACQKVPIVDIQAGFTLADVSWFAEEKTMFVFYSVTAQQGIGPESQIEITWRTDNGEQSWTALSELTPIHTHLPVLCGLNTLCGSWSFKVVDEPRFVGLRLKYHRIGEVVLDAPVALNIIGPGPSWSNRSLTVYGVFDEKNDKVQWRARNVFPTIRNEDASQKFGLRRYFRVEEMKVGDLPVASMSNPYGYATLASCPFTMTDLGFPPLETTNRAIFDTHVVPLFAATLPVVCARSIVNDAKGTFAGTAIARKNPEVRPAFPALKSPIKPSKALGFLLKPCFREISKTHLDMQIQRMQLETQPEICIDTFKDPAWVDQFVARVRARIEATRPEGQDMTIVLGVHHDDTKGELGLQIENGLAKILSLEKDLSSPHVSGALVFDSLQYKLQIDGLKNLVLWCPAKLPNPLIPTDDLDKIPITSERACPLLPDQPDINLGPFKFGTLPILPTRPQYLTFLMKYSDAQAGRVTELSFLAPERTPVSENINLGDFGVGTLYNNEIITADASDAFSFCSSGDAAAGIAIFKSDTLGMPLPLASLPQLHQLLPEAQYRLGLFWDFPFLTRLRYEAVLAGAASAFSFTIPFGISAVNKAYYGTALWDPPCNRCNASDVCVNPGDGADCFPISAVCQETCAAGSACILNGQMAQCARKVKAGEFTLDHTLIQCDRFCTHPTMHGGVYNVLQPFSPVFQTQCYAPIYPRPGEDFPRDP